jgi:hypothetical protein
MSQQTQSTLERAFELASAGGCRTVTELRLTLRSEGFDPDQVTGPLLLRQLNGMIEAARFPERAAEKQAARKASQRRNE